MKKRFRVYTDHVGGIAIGEPVYRELTEAKARKITKALQARGLNALYTYSEIDSI